MSQLTNQMLFKKLKSQYARIGKRDIMLTQSNLFLVQDLTAVNTQYTFEILNNEGTPKSYEIRLAQTDSFHLSGIQFFISDAGATPDDPTVELLTYENQVLLGAGFAGWRSLYKGQFDITINNVTVLQSLSAQKFKYVPQTQHLVAGAGNAVDQVRWATDSMFYFAPTLNISGAKKNQITLTIPQAVAGAVANQVVGCILHGVVAIGGSVFQN